MHLRVKGMEWTFKIYLHQDSKSWSMPGMQDKKAERMAELKAIVKKEMGVDIYKVCPGKVGNSNSGNCARRVFSKIDKLAEIVGAPVDLIRDLWTLISAANSTDDICPDKTEELAKDWLRRFAASSIKWNWPNPSIHALIKHGSSIFRHSYL